MKKKCFVIIAVLLVVVALFGGCGDKLNEKENVEMTNNKSLMVNEWISFGSLSGNGAYKIIRSPITNKYYEMTVQCFGNSPTYVSGMSEVTEEEYNKYLKMINDD